MNTAVGYIRVSTEEQSREGISLEMQTEKIKQYAGLNDLTILEIIEDAGVSGKTIKARPGVQRVLSLVRSKQVDGVIVYSLSRLGRNTIEILEMTETMDKYGVALHSITEKLDTQSAMGRFFFTLTASLAQMERQLISERTAAALATKKGKGEKTGGSVPYGYTVADGVLVAEESEQIVISFVRKLRQQGLSIRRIAYTLTSEGTFNRKGRPFQHTQIVRILKAA